MVWNKTLAERHRAYHVENRRISYKEADAALTAWKKNDDLAFLSEVSSVPLQQALRHQHAAFGGFFAGRARYPRFRTRGSRQSAHYTRSAFRMRDGELRMVKTTAPLAFVWSFDEVDLAALDPTMVVISREPHGRWYVAFAIDADEPAPLETAGHEVGVDLGVKDFAVTSEGGRIANPKHRTRHDRDVNAAKNILAAGRAVAGDIPGDVCGAEVRRQGTSLPQSAAKQEHPRREP
ncbi:RNA-guided endonuclease InsQ/TnpB family protein [Actinomadura violacea]|uniref:RNA-guided endonuclease InsQ/TnpB family protein n=1 Tax=Actinomadura violacea TaxID=2819934 RepID=UPI001E30981D|nr:RNA-guided endonuclease TnpB family protein [Actinomadura violacea]